MVRLMAMELCTMRTRTFTRVYFATIYIMAKGYYAKLMAKSIAVHGKTTKRRASGRKSTLKGLYMKAVSKEVPDMAMEN